jgi:hypothetical protein
MYADQSKALVASGIRAMCPLDPIGCSPEATLQPVWMRFQNYRPPVVGFAVGAQFGAFMLEAGGFVSIFIPTALVSGLASLACAKAYP